MKVTTQIPSSTSFNPSLWPAMTVEILIFFLCMQMREGKLIDERLATRTDFELVHAEFEQHRLTTKADIHEAESRLETRIAETNAQIIMWVMGNRLRASRRASRDDPQ